MKRLLTFACALGMASLLQAEYLLPETISLTPDGKALIIGEKGAGKVSIRDFSGKELASYDADIAPWWTFGLGDNSTLQVTGATMSPDGSDLFYTADNGNEGRLFNKAGDSVVTGNCPMTPTVSPDGKYVYVCNRFDNNVQKYDAKTLKLLATAPALREANGCALGKDGKLLFVINLLPTDAAEPVGYVAAKVTVVDTGLNTMTGGRVKRVRDYVGDEPFMLTYGDGVSDLNIAELVKFHQSHGKLVTMSAYNAGQRFGVLDVEKQERERM